MDPWGSILVALGVKFFAFFGSSLLVLVGEMGYLFLVPHLFGNNLIVTRSGLNLKPLWEPEKLTNILFAYFEAWGCINFFCCLFHFFLDEIS